MSSPDETAAAATPAADVPAPDTAAHDTSAADTFAADTAAADTSAPDTSAAAPPPPVPDADDDVIDAELVPTPDTTLAPQVTTPAFDYTDAGVPTLDYLRDRIEKRLGTAEGSAELGGSLDAQERQRRADEERAEKAAAKLAEIRRQVTGDR